MPDSKPEQLTVKILGREYRLSCTPGEKDALLAAVAYVDEKMSTIRDHGKVAGNDRIAVFAALNIANELLSTRAPDGEFSELAFGEFRRRIESMSAALDAALSPQEKLF
jgi:cell division protein ZapA